MASVQQLQNTLKLTFGIVPIVAGLDKFTNLLTNWSDYLGSSIRGMLPLDPLVFMKVVGTQLTLIAGKK